MEIKSLYCIGMHQHQTAEEYRRRITAHRQAFAPVDSAFPLDEGDILYCGSPEAIPPWCSLLYLTQWDAISPELTEEIRLATTIFPDAGEIDVLQRMAEGAQVLFFADPPEDRLIELARDADRKVLIGSASRSMTPTDGFDLWQDRAVYSCEAVPLATHLAARQEHSGAGWPLPVNGTVLAPHEHPSISGILPALPAEQQARMTSAAVQLRLALPGVPVLHPSEVELEGVEPCIFARIASVLFHPQNPGTLLKAPEGMIALRRDHPEEGTVLCLHNLSRDYLEYRHRKDRFPWPETGVLRDLIADDLVFPTSEGALFSLELTPYETLWLAFQ